MKWCKYDVITQKSKWYKLINITVFLFCSYLLILIWVEFPYFFVLMFVLFNKVATFFCILDLIMLFLLIMILYIMILIKFCTITDVILNHLLILTLILYFLSVCSSQIDLPISLTIVCMFWLIVRVLCNFYLDFILLG